MSKLTANEIQFVRSQLEVPDAPHEPCERVAACIAQWNRLPLAKLADSIEQFEWAEGYNKALRNEIHLQFHIFHEFAPTWCNKLGHITPSTFCCSQNGFLSWVAWMTICKDAKRIPVPIPLVPPKNRPRSGFRSQMVDFPAGDV